MRPLSLLLLIACGPGSDPPGTSGPLGSDASLADLSLPEAELRPAFDPTRVLYSADADTDVLLVATPTDPEATVAFVVEDMFGTELDRIDGPEAGVDLEGGERVMVEVTSADGTAQTRTQLTVIPFNFPELDVWSDDPSPGYVFTTNMDFLPPIVPLGRYRMVLDTLGIPLFLQRMQDIDFDFRPAPDDGMSWTTLTPDSIRSHAVGPNGEDRGTWSPVNATGDIHEFALLPNGSALIIGGRTTVVDLSAYGGDSDALVMHQVAQELAPDGSLVFEWSTEGQVDPAHLPGDTIPPSQEAIELAHMNSIEVDPHDGNWVISLRLPSQVVKVDRSTGEVLWRLGGPGSDFTFIDDERANGWQGFAWQHSARITGPDRVLVFDNAVTVEFGEASGDSRYVEYQLDTSAMTATRIASWELPNSGWTDAAGSAQRLANGNTLVGFGNKLFTADGRAPQVVEVDPDGIVVFQLVLPQAEWSYRSTKFDRDTDGWVIP